MDSPKVRISPTLAGTIQICKSTLTTLGVPSALARRRAAGADALGPVPCIVPLDNGPYVSLIWVTLAAISVRACSQGILSHFPPPLLPARFTGYITRSRL